MSKSLSPFATRLTWEEMHQRDLATLARREAAEARAAQKAQVERQMAESRRSGGAVRMYARYTSGTCPNCEQPIIAGQDCQYDRIDRVMWHHDCGDAACDSSVDAELRDLYQAGMRSVHATYDR